MSDLRRLRTAIFIRQAFFDLVEENSLEVYLMPTISLKMLEYVIENDRIPSEKELQQVFKKIQLLFN